MQGNDDLRRPILSLYCPELPEEPGGAGRGAGAAEGARVCREPAEPGSRGASRPGCEHRPSLPRGEATTSEARKLCRVCPVSAHSRLLLREWESSHRDVVGNVREPLIGTCCGIKEIKFSRLAGKEESMIRSVCSTLTGF